MARVRSLIDVPGACLVAVPRPADVCQTIHPRCGWGRVWPRGRRKATVLARVRGKDTSQVVDAVTNKTSAGRS